MIKPMPMLFLILLLGMSFNRKHLLLMLLCLEGMMLIVFMSLIMTTQNLNMTPLMFPIILLTISACEAALGLSLMVATARSHGSDILKTLNLLKC